MNLQRAIKISSTKILQLDIVDDDGVFFLKITQLFADPIEKIYDDEFVKKEISLGVSQVLNKDEYLELIKFITDFINQISDVQQDKNDVIKDVQDWLEDNSKE